MWLEHWSPVFVIAKMQGPEVAGGLGFAEAKLVQNDALGKVGGDGVLFGMALRRVGHEEL